MFAALRENVPSPGPIVRVARRGASGGVLHRAWREQYQTQPGKGTRGASRALGQLAADSFRFVSFDTGGPMAGRNETKRKNETGRNESPQPQLFCHVAEFTSRLKNRETAVSRRVGRDV